MAHPMEQAFALIADHGARAAYDLVVDGIDRAAPCRLPKDGQECRAACVEAVEGWVAIGECLKRIAALVTVH